MRNYKTETLTIEMDAPTLVKQLEAADALASQLRLAREADIRRRVGAGQIRARVAELYGISPMWVTRIVAGTHRGEGKKAYYLKYRDGAGAKQDADAYIPSEAERAAMTELPGMPEREIAGAGK